MPKKYKNMTDEELDKLFKDAAENFKNSNPPEGAWEAFYTRNKQQLKDNGEEPVQELNKRLPRFFTLGKAYRTAAAVLILVAACAIVWSIVSKQKRMTPALLLKRARGHLLIQPGM